MTSNHAIAVVGLGCILPDAIDTSTFWANTLRGHSALRPLSLRTYDWSHYRRESDGAARVFAEPIGAEIGPHPFDWRKFKISPLDAQAINPMHLHVLEAAAQALEEVKVLPHATTGTFVGGTGLGWQRDSGARIRLPEFLDAICRADSFAALPQKARNAVLDQVRGSLEQRLRPVSDDSAVNTLGSIAAGRLALRFDLRGPHCGIDAGFASGLAAVTTAVQSLRDGTIDLAIAGGASEQITPLDLLAFHELSVLASHRVRPFDCEASGTLLGEGTVFFALKRLSDALADGELIYALLRGTGAASDGRGRSLLSPSVDGQSLAMERAYAEAGLEPDTVGYVECHATGTPVGDASEIHALARVFGRGKAGGIAVGSAKPFVGHLRGASGAVGLLRAVLALHHKTIPAQIEFTRPHPNLELDSTPFFVPAEQVPLEPRSGAPNARAAVSSFGLGGNEYHAVLEAWTPGGLRSAPRAARPPAEPIAILGLGGVFPKANDIPSFWRALLEGKDAARDVPASRWPIDRYYDPDPSRLDTTYTRVGCFVEPVPDPGKEFRSPPVARSRIDPGHLMIFRAAEEAVADAGLEATTWDRNRTAVILGYMASQGRRLLAEARLNFREVETELEKALGSNGVSAEQVNAILSEAEGNALSELPSVTEDTLPGYLGSFNAAHVARRFDLRGPHFVVDSACASSLAALEAAVRLLRQGIADTVLLGGVWADTQPEFFVENCRFSALTASAITPFDERASGFVPGEGAAVLVLRRAADAERDGQRVHALIRSVEGSSDGGAGRSVYSPSLEGESLAMQRALEAAGVAPGDVDYVECHGTGTALGDVVEIEACTRAYGTGRQRPLLVGSVKSNIGHLMAGAGAASLVKTTLALREGVIPASIKVQKLNPKIDFASGPVEVVTSTTRWETPGGRPRRAGVSGFGLGGSNFHVVLEEYRPTASGGAIAGGGSTGGKATPPVLPIATVQGRDLASCARAMASLALDLKSGGVDRFWNAVAESQTGSIGEDPYRVAIVAGEPELLAERAKLLDGVLASGHDPSFLRAQGVFVAQADSAERIAAVFPGQGPQYPNMLRSASATFPVLASTLDRIDRAYEAICGRKLRPSFFTDDPQSYLQSDEDIHCAVFAVNVALFSLLESYGARIDAVMGQSAGELSALVAARSISVEDGLRAIRERTLAVLGIETPDPGRMVTLSCGADRAERIMRGLPGYAALAADNGPSACIVSGNRPAVQALLERAASEGIEANVLAVSHGYHSQLIAAARPHYRATLDSITFRPPELELFSSITGSSIGSLPATGYAAHLESQFVKPVLLRQAVTALHENGVRLFVECGPKWPLTTFISEILAGLPYVAQATIHPKVGEVEQLHRAIACLFVHRACELEPGRIVPMTVSNTSLSQKPAADPRTSANPSSGALEAELLTILRTIRDLVERALGPYEDAATKQDKKPVDSAERPAASQTGSGAASHEEHEAAALPSLSPAPSAKPTPVASVPQEDLRQSVHALIVAELVKRTGYPEEMIEPDLDLEAELGIDTVKQVASMAAVRERYGLQPDPKFRMQDTRTLRQAVDYLVGRISAAQVRTPVSSVVNTETSAELSHSPPHEVATVAASAPQPEASRVAPDALRISEDVRRLLTAELVKRTGYPEDMLGLDLDLEAELGIDTVKQVAALAAVREQYRLEPDPQFRLQDARTLRQAVDYLAKRIVSAGRPVTSARAVSTADLSDPTTRQVAPAQSQLASEKRPLSLGSSRTDPQPPADRPTAIPGFPPALGDPQELLKTLALLIAQGSHNWPNSDRTAVAPSAGQQTANVGGGASRAVYPAILLESLLSQAGCPWKGEVLEMTGLAIADADSTLPIVASQATDLLPLHARDPEGQVAARSRLVRASGLTTSAAPGMLSAVNEGRKSPNDPMLRDYMEKSGRASASSIEWAHSQGFTLAVGGARLASDDAGPAHAMLSMLGCAFDVASFVWFGFSGAVHSLSAVDRLRFHRIPVPGDEMLICARMAPPEGGLWRADIAVFDCSGGLYAEFSGLEGTPIASSDVAIASQSSDPAGQAWRRFAHRLGRGAVPAIEDKKS